MSNNGPHLSRRLAFAVAVTLLVTTFVYIFLSYTNERREYMHLLAGQADEYLDVVTSQLAFPLYNVNQDAVTVIGDSFAVNNLIAAITIKADKGTIAYTFRKPHTGAALSRFNTIRYKGEVMGTVNIELTAEPYERRSLAMLRSHLLNLAITTVLVVFITMIILRAMLKKPLEFLHDSVSSLAEGKEFIIPENTYAEFESTLKTTTAMAHKISQQMQELREAEKKYRDIYFNAVEGLFQSSLEDCFISLNPASVKLLGYTTSEEALSSITSIKDQLYADKASFHKIHQLLLNNGQLSGFEVQFKRKDGGLFWASLTMRAVVDAAGSLLYHEGSMIDITKSKQKEQAEREREVALRANKAKSNFLAKISHEIRTPMNAILGMAELLSESSLTEGQKKNLDNLQMAGTHLLNIISDILNYSRLADKGIQLEYLALDLHELAQECVTLMEPTATKKGLSVKLIYDDALPPFVLGDPLRLKQVLVNLLGNAIKFTEQGEVTLKLEAVPVEQLKNSPETAPLTADTPADSVFLRASVIDTGIGIAPEAIPRLFQQFSQADSSITRKFGGTGLGLAISREIITLMNGTIWIESEINKGSRFIAVLPLCPATELHALSQPASATDAEPAQEIFLKPMKLLLVDDSDMNREMIVAYLENQPITVIEADNGRDAMELAAYEGFDLILMDIEMPDMDGVTATRNIRAHEQQAATSQTPIYALTAHAIKEQEIECLKAGFNLVLTKPLRKKVLLEALQKINSPDRSPAIDFPQLIEEFTDDSQLALNMLHKYNSRIPAILQDAQAALDGSDFELLRQLAHRNKGTAANLTAYPLSTAAGNLETAAQAGDAIECARCLEAFCFECSEMTECINQIDYTYQKGMIV